VRWPNGDEVSVGRIELCPEDGLQQQLTITGPAPPPSKVVELSTPAVSVTECRENGKIYQVVNGPCDNGAGGAPPAPQVARGPSVEVNPSRSAAPPPPPRSATRSGRGPTRLSVRLLKKAFNETVFDFIVPGTVDTYRTDSANCYGNSSGTLTANRIGDTVYGRTNSTTTVNCQGSGTTQTTVTPAREVRYPVQGAALSLQLPDGRIAVVNCNSKLNWTQFTGGPRRSCRIPTTDRFDAEFNGDKAKLIWRVGINAEKVVSETYDLVEILDPPSP
jgi:hypothetical protein